MNDSEHWTIWMCSRHPAYTRAERGTAKSTLQCPLSGPDDMHLMEAIEVVDDFKFVWVEAERDALAEKLKEILDTTHSIVDALRITCATLSYISSMSDIEAVRTAAENTMLDISERMTRLPKLSK